MHLPHTNKNTEKFPMVRSQNIKFDYNHIFCSFSCMKECMKMTSETLFTTSTWYEAENGSNQSCNFVFNSGPQVCSGPSIPKHAVKVCIFPEFETDKSIFTGWIWIFTRWIWTYLFTIDNAVFTGWICIFTWWIWTYLFQIRESLNFYDMFRSWCLVGR